MAASVVLFILSHFVPPLYYSNQNTKFLHGLARAFPDRLGADWTAGTVDGLPVFSALVCQVARLGHPAAFLLIEAALLVAFVLSMLSIGGRLADPSTPPARLRLFLGGVLAALAAPQTLRALDGVAGQYAVGGYLQPSEFAVLFFLALALWGEGRKTLATLAAAAPALVLPAYIPTAAILAGTLMLSRWRDDGVRPPWLLTLSVLACLIGPQTDLALRFPPTSPALAHEATRVIAFDIIPFHSRPALWFRAGALARLLLAVTAVGLAPPGVVRRAMAALLAFAVGGAVLALVTGSAALALLAPWRTSVVLTPLSVVVAAGWLFDRLGRLPQGRRWQTAACAAAAIAGALGAAHGALRKARDFDPGRTREAAVFVLAHHAPSDLYLTEPHDYRFRLQAMTAQVINLKTHPYRDLEVLEWRRRTRMALVVYVLPGPAGPARLNCAALRDLAVAYPVTHVLLDGPWRGAAACPFLTPAFEGRAARILILDRARLASGA